MQGVVSFIQRKQKGKSYGFITDGERSYFFLLGDKDLRIGEKVVFEGSKNEKGYIAIDVKPDDVLTDTDTD